MKDLFKKVIVFIITIEARLILWRYKPKIIAVTGSVGKTSTKDVIFSALSNCVHIRKNNKSLNSEIGVPLTIIGCDSGWTNLIAWTKIIAIGFARLIYQKKYPKWLVLETGVDRPGDMKRTASWLKPDVAIFTAIGDVPVHVEFFDDVDHIVEEKSKLLDYVKETGVVFVNADDKNALKIKSKSKVRVVTYSTKSEEADFFASNYNIVYEKRDGSNFPKGVSFKINYGGNVLPINLNGVLGEQYVYPGLIAIAVANELGLSVVLASAGLNNFNPAPGRMRILDGIRNSIIIDDTYNASPVAVDKALHNLMSVENSGKKIAVLGDMLELGKFSVTEHKKIGETVAQLGIDCLITVGIRAESIAERAIELGMDEKKVVKVGKSTKARDVVLNFMEDNSVILVKGSQGARMERIVEAVMKNPERKGELLVRQEVEWQKR